MSSRVIPSLTRRSGIGVASFFCLLVLLLLNSAEALATAPAVTNVQPDTGPTNGGTSVIITGSGFSEVTEVKFGATKATSFTTDSGTMISAVAPSGTSTVDVRVKTSKEGESAIGSVDQFIYRKSVVVGWGANAYAQLGNGTATTSDNTPTESGGLTAPIGLATGRYHSLALLASGEVMAAGYDNQGQIGNGSTVYAGYGWTSVCASGGCSGQLKEAVAVAAGKEYSMALEKNGTVVSWGENKYGQLGNGTTTTSTLPVVVCAVGGCGSHLEGVVAIAAGTFFSMALLSSGEVVTWGNNEVGQLGDNSTERSHVPVYVSGLKEVVAISANSNGGIALLKNGTVKVWGSNRMGQLGKESSSGPEKCEEETVACSAVPVAMPELSGVSAVSGGGEFTVALLNTGTMKAWGFGAYGSLGDGKAEAKFTPTSVCENTSCSKALGEVSSIATGINQGLAALRSGKVVAWGENSYGQLGDGTSTGPETCAVSIYCSKTPVEASNLVEAVEVAAGEGKSSLGEESSETCFGKVMSALAPTSACPYPDKESTGAKGSLETVVVPKGTYAPYYTLIVNEGESVSNKRIFGGVEVRGNNVKLENDEIIAPASEQAIKIPEPYTNAIVKDVTCRLEGGEGYDESCFWDQTAGNKVTGSSFENCVECFHGPGTLEDSFVLANAESPGSHNEGVFYGGGEGPLTIRGNTIFEALGQTAAVFVDHSGGNVDGVYIEENMLAGGDAAVYGGSSGNAAYKLVGPVRVKRNDFPRCTGSPFFGTGEEAGYEFCVNGEEGGGSGVEEETLGYFPRDGKDGLDLEFEATVTTWEGNYWDNNKEEAKE